MNINANLYRITMYIVMGGLTTLVNIVSFWLFATYFGMDYRIANTIAWVLAVLFAYVTNKKYVFQSRTSPGRQTLKELGSFFGFRFLSYLMDLGLMIVLVSGLSMNGTIAKIWTNVVVMIANYVFSKAFIFKNQSRPEQGREGEASMKNAVKRWPAKPIWFWIGVAVFYLYIAWNTPLTHDDWTWAGPVGMARLHTWFQGYSGRYLGNLLELLLTRSAWLRILAMGLFSTLLVYLTSRVAGRGTKVASFLAFIAFLTVPLGMYAQTFAWTAGYVNYVPSIVLTLLYALVTQNVFGEELPAYNRALTLYVIPLGIASQLFVEHVTIYNILYACFVILYSLMRFHKVYLVHAAYLVSVLIGAAIMFSNSVYTKIFTGKDHYRSIGGSKATTGSVHATSQAVHAAAHHVSLIHKAITLYTTKLNPLLFTDNLVLNILLAVVGCWVLFTSARSGWVKKVVAFVLVVFPLYDLVLAGSSNLQFLGRRTDELTTLVTALFFLALLATGWLYVESRAVRIRSVLYLVSSLVLAAPFLVVKPFGPRCFLASYTFFVLVLLEWTVYLAESKAMDLKWLRRLAAGLAIVLVLCYVYVFTLIGIASRARVTEIHQQLSQHVQFVHVAQLPYEQFLWHGTPVPGSYQYKTFKQFFGIPESTPVVFTGYKHLL